MALFTGLPRRLAVGKEKRAEKRAEYEREKEKRAGVSLLGEPRPFSAAARAFDVAHRAE